MVGHGFEVRHALCSCFVGAKSAKRGEGLAFIYSTALSARTTQSHFQSTLFKFQLIGLKVGGVSFKVASIYRPPSSSNSVFIEKLADLLTSDDTGPSERLVL